MTPDFSVILVSDFAAGDQKSWDDLRKVLEALKRQTYSGPVEYVLVENEVTARHIPQDLLNIVPGLRIVTSPHTGSYELRNHGVQEARASLLAILDVDCVPSPGWLANIAAAWSAHPTAAAIGGRTTYEAKGTFERLAALLSRSYVDRGYAGKTRYIASNNCSWRRSVYLVHPRPHGMGPFACLIQSEAVLRDGGEFFFVPEISVVHNFEGWRMEADIRKNAGYGTVITRLKDPRMPYAGLIRLGRLSIPLIFAGKTLDALKNLLRCWRYFGLRVFEIPLAMAMAPVVIALEIPGMLAAFGNRSIGQISFR